MKAPSPVLILGICLSIAFVNLVTTPASSTPRAAGFVVGLAGAPIVIGSFYLAWYWLRHRKAS